MTSNMANVILRLVMALLSLAAVGGWLVGVPFAWHFGKHHASWPMAFGFTWAITAAVIVFVLTMSWLVGRASQESEHH